jgi:hypothetical protein
MSDALLSLWIALIAADRIDLAGGHGPFILTPFLALTPLVALSELIRRTLRGKAVAVPQRIVVYLALASALLALVLTSSFVSLDFSVSGSRAVLLVAQVFGTFTVALLSCDRPDAMRLFARGALLALPLFVACDVLESLWWIGRAPEILRFGPASIHFNELQNLGPFPRLAGAVSDSNRTGFVLVVYIVMMAAGESRRYWRRFGIGLAVVLLGLTFSRSAALAALGTWAMVMLTTRRRIPVRSLAGAAVIGCAAVALAMYNPRVLDRVSALAYSPLASRVSTSEGSAKGHLALIGRGVGEATASVPRSMIGLGYGNAYLVLQDMFPNNRYGNFHSLYVTMFAESGVFALLLVLALMVVPLWSSGPWRTLVVGAMAFNLFYQAAAEPIFWFLLAAAWLAMSGEAFRPQTMRGSIYRRFVPPSVSS